MNNTGHYIYAFWQRLSTVGKIGIRIYKISIFSLRISVNEFLMENRVDA